MRRRLTTGKIVRVERSVEARPVRLIVDYDDVEDFLADYIETLSRGRGQVLSARGLAPGSTIEIGFEFPGLLEAIVVTGVVRSSNLTEGSEGVSVDFELLASANAALQGIVERINAGDRTLISPLLRVLIVEDNRHVSELVRRGLLAAGRRELRGLALACEIANDGASALQLLTSKRFGAVIIDVYLPVLDGAAVIRQVRQNLGLADLPIIGISGGGDAARHVALRAGATEFLDKPVQLRQILTTMCRLVPIEASR